MAEERRSLPCCRVCSAPQTALRLMTATLRGLIHTTIRPDGDYSYTAHIDESSAEVTGPTGLVWQFSTSYDIHALSRDWLFQEFHQRGRQHYSIPPVYDCTTSFHIHEANGRLQFFRLEHEGDCIYDPAML